MHAAHSYMYKCTHLHTHTHTHTHTPYHMLINVPSILPSDFLMRVPRVLPFNVYTYFDVVTEHFDLYLCICCATCTMYIHVLDMAFPLHMCACIYDGCKTGHGYSLLMRANELISVQDRWLVGLLCVTLSVAL